MSSARPNRSGPFLDLARDEVGEIFRSPPLRRDHRHAEALEALAPSRGLHRFFPRRLENLDRYDTVFVDSDTAISRLSFRWSEQQPEAFSDRTGKKEIYQRGGMIVRPALTPAKTFHDRDTEAWRIMEVSSGYFAETLARAAQWFKYDSRRRKWIGRRIRAAANAAIPNGAGDAEAVGR
jgi:hypothetical protein